MRSQYADPAARQPHRDKGLEFLNSVVSVRVEGSPNAGSVFGSGVLIGDGTCLLLSWHQLRDLKVSRPLNLHVWITTGPNYLTDPGESVDVVDFVAHPNAPAPGQVGSDLVVAKLSRRPANAKPMEITETPPAIGDVVELAGFGNPYIPYVPLTLAGELLGGNAPVHNRTDPQTSIALTTKFDSLNSEGIPLRFGATNGDSGGMMTRTVTALDGSLKKVLSGTMISGTTPTCCQYTFSMNLALFRTWIHEQVAIFSTAPPVVPALACALQPGGQMKVSCGGVPMIQIGGRWLAEETPGMTGWQPLPAAEQDTLATTRELLRPLSVPKTFFRLRWQPAP